MGSKYMFAVVMVIPSMKLRAFFSFIGQNNSTHRPRDVPAKILLHGGSLVQPASHGHVHEVMHALGHLPAQTIDVMIVVHQHSCCLESGLEGILRFKPWLLRQSELQAMPNPCHCCFV